ncbi:MAG: GIY-YIG nuclease family protein [bacterium]
MCYVYILFSKKANKFYYGYTNNLRKRIELHNNGRVRSTMPYRPWKLMQYCAFIDGKKAKEFEKYLKTGSGKAFAYKRFLNVALVKYVGEEKR